MRVEVLYFAVLRERARSEGETLELPGDTTVAEARKAIAGRHPEMAPLLSRVRTAVNQEMAPDDRRLADGDELALIPPVAGGAGEASRRIAVRSQPLSLDEVLAEVRGPEQGAVVTFTGVVRRQGQRPDVIRLEYEAYERMALQVLGAIVQEVEHEWRGTRVAVHHRTGALTVGEPAVVIAVSAPHRAEAFEACRAVIERLKQRAPIWKKEIGEDGAEWVGMGP